MLFELIPMNIEFEIMLNYQLGFTLFIRKTTLVGKFSRDNQSYLKLMRLNCFDILFFCTILSLSNSRI